MSFFIVVIIIIITVIIIVIIILDISCFFMEAQSCWNSCRFVSRTAVSGAMGHSVVRCVAACAETLCAVRRLRCIGMRIVLTVIKCFGNTDNGL